VEEHIVIQSHSILHLGREAGEKGELQSQGVGLEEPKVRGVSCQDEVNCWAVVMTETKVDWSQK